MEETSLTLKTSTTTTDVDKRTSENPYVEAEKPIEDSSVTSSDVIRETGKSSAVQEIVWGNVLRFSYAHLAALYGLYKIAVEGQYYSALFAFVYGTCGLIGITAGAHRLWSHRAYRAKWQLRLTLAIFETMAFQNSIYEWARDHRVHHKFTETDADPHNAKRGFFFSHIGWLLMNKHPHIREKGKVVDLSDLKNDPIVMWQKKYYLILMPVLAFVVPTWIQIQFFNCNLWTSWHITMLRWILSLHMTWLVNSAAHLWGKRPYDRNINPAENLMVAICAYGEGWHNYHHVFPYDYKTSEHGFFNPTKSFIDFFSLIGWAYDLKTVSDDAIRRRVIRTGDGTHDVYNIDSNVVHSKEKPVWGWGDSDINKDDFDYITLK